MLAEKRLYDTIALYFFEIFWQTVMVNQSLVFEQPVNELVRVCLRLEHLLSMIQAGLKGESDYDTRSAVSVLINILLLTDRPDLRGKFTKELLRQRANFQRFLDQDRIDQVKLNHTLSELEKHISALQNKSGKFGAELRDIEFLNNIRQHLSTSGGGLGFDTPAFFYWLSSPVKKRHGEIIEWLSTLEDLFQIIQFQLRLLRQSGQPVLATAREGFFQTSLDPQTPCQLIRVTVPVALGVFPEISVGRHGAGIRFYKPNHHAMEKERPQPADGDISFYLSCCVV